MPDARLKQPHAVLPATTIIAILWSLASIAPAQLSGEAELATLKAAPGIEVSLFASEPLITNPAALDVDTHGRVWVAEIQWYRGGAKVPAADKIKVLEDTDGDGRADKATVFTEQVFAPMSICVAGSKVYVATSPDLWVYDDADGDLKADGPPTKLLTGFGGHNHDHGAHSLVLGPDHKWWMSHGDTGFDVRGTDGSRAAYRWGAVLRGELDGSQLETVAVNFRNPYEVCVSSFGEAYLSDNDNDGNESVRICWILEGGNYGWFGGPPFAKQDLAARLSADTPYRDHWHFRGHVPGFVPATLVTGFGSPTGICYYEGDAFGPQFKNAPLHTDCGPRECRVYRHEPDGFGLRATSEVFLSNDGDNYFRPDDICAAADGRLYVADWYDGGVGGHGYNNPEQGRIFMLTPAGKRLARREKPGPYATIADALQGLRSPNLATQYLARQRLLAEGSKSVAALRELLSSSEPNDAARALWVLDRIGGEGRAAVAEQLKSSNDALRALAVRILRRHDLAAEGGREYADSILALASDPSAEVRREVLLAIGALNGDAADGALAKIARSYDGGDRYQLEAINVAAGDRQADLLARLQAGGPLGIEQFSLLQVLSPKRASEMVVARLNDSDLDDKQSQRLLEIAVNIPSVEAGWGLLAIAVDGTKGPALRRAAFGKVVANADDRGNWIAMAGDSRLTGAVEKLLADRELRSLALAAAASLHLRALAPQVLAIAASAGIDAPVRAQAVGVAAALRPRSSGDALRGLLDDPQPQVAQAALRALVDVQNVRVLREILCGGKFATDVRRETAERLVDTTGGALVLLRLVDENKLPDELTKLVVARATVHPDSNIRVLYEKFIPEEERPKKLGQAIAAHDILSLEGDANRGREIFDRSSAAQCKACHAVQGFGGQLGPELTNIGKKYERRTLLETIIEPSKAIAPEYVPYVLETSDGQVHAGFLVERTDKQVILKDVKGRLVRVATGDIEVLLAQPKSLMPELVLSEITAQDAADLLAFLTTLK